MEDMSSFVSESLAPSDDDQNSLTEWRNEDHLRKSGGINVWSPGDHCLSPWSGDKKYFPGKIKSIKKTSGAVLALISYNDYSSEEDEEIDVRQLKKIDKRDKQKSVRHLKKNDNSEATGFFKPLDANIEAQRLRDKYGSYSDEEIEKKMDNWFTKKVFSSPIKSPKLPLARGGSALLDDKTRKNKIWRQQKDESDLLTESSNSRTGSPEPLPSTSGNHTIDDRGFERENIEKPKFNFPAVGTKVPFLLSEIGSEPPIQVPAAINQYLRDYQREGIKFLFSHYKENRGALLGDDMGLGKTVQVIGFLSAILRKNGNSGDLMRRKPLFIRQLSATADLLEDLPARPVLIIGPGSVLYNWIDELDTWGYFTVGKYHGNEKQQCLMDLQKNKLDVVITTFETFRENQDELNMIEWEVVIADEVHKIKGLKAQTTQALRTIQVPRRYGLTGTALQNNMKEVWSILDWVQPGCCGDLAHFEDYFVSVIEKGQQHEATKGELAIARKRKEEFSNIREKIMIRRLKSLIADQLPKKDDNVVFCKLSELQISVYKTILEQPDVQFVLHMDDPCLCGSGVKQSRCCDKYTADAVPIRSIFFTYLHLLLKTANHVALLIPHSTMGATQTEYATYICQIIFQSYPQFVNQIREAAFKTLSDPEYCGKMKVLKGLLSVFHKEHAKVLVFSYSTKLLDIIERYLMTTGYEYRRFDGSTSAKKRLEVVWEFNKDPNIFICLISTKAGGLGLNLTGANKVIIFDPNWNPTHDLQAQDRAYRIGQSRNVQVFRLVSAGTIEENIYLRQIYKQQLDNVAIATANAKRYFHGIQGNKEKKGELFGAKNMFQFRTGDSCLTLDILERNQKVETSVTGFKMAKYIPASSIKQECEVEEEGKTLPDEAADSDDDLDIFADLFSPDVDDSDDIDGDRSNRDSTTNDVQDPLSEQLSKSVKRKKSSAVKTDTLHAGPNHKKSVEKRKAKKRSECENSSRFIKTEEECSRSYSSVGDVLGTCNVLHVHENRRIVGASKAEDYMSRCAVQEVYELHQNSELPAVQCDPLSESSEEDLPAPAVTPKGKKKAKNDHNTPRTEVVGRLRVLIGQTPKAIKHQQFQKLCDFLGKDSLTSLAEYIFESSVSERLKILDQFYESQDKQLQGLLNVGKEEVYDIQKNSCDKKAGTKENVLSRSAKKRSDQKKSLFGSTHELSDSETTECHQTISKSVATKLTYNDSDLMEVGKPPSPSPSRKKNTRISMKTRLRSKQNVSKYKTFDTQVQTKDILNLDDDSKSIEHSDWLDRIPMNLSNTEHADQLLDEIGTGLEEVGSVGGREESTCTHSDKHKTDSRLNLLDNIFSGAEDNKSSRKPPPRKLNKLSKKDSPRQGEKSVVSDQLDSMFTEPYNEHPVYENTLKEESLDCFSDPTKWKKKQKRRADHLSTVDRLISEGNNDYKNLFTEGKLRKRDKKEYNSLSEQEACDDNQSLSLF